MKTDRIIAISSMLVSLLTLVLFIYEINLVRKQQYASVLPYCYIIHSGPGTDHYQLQLVNEGLGPGFVTSIKVVRDGKESAGDPATYIQGLSTLSKDSANISYTSVAEGTIVAVGRPIAMIDANGLASSAFALKNFSGDNSYIEIEYRSVYDEKWRIRSGSMVPEKLDK